MNEIKKCSIAGISFTLEKDAYEALQTYIKSLNDTYKNNPDGEEIIADIEARIAELILSTQPAEGIVAKPLIDNIIKQLGSAEEIDEEGAEHHAENIDQNGNPRIPRRLYRDLENKKLGGVCAGVANYFDVDSTWIRLAMFIPLVITIFGSVDIFRWIAPFSGNLFGFVIIGYAIMWFTIPAASSARQKLEMKGERVTARNIHEATQAPSLDERERTMLAKVVMAAGSLLLIIFKVIALFILIGLVVGVSVLSFVALVTSPALLTTDFITGLALACFFMVVILPILVLIYLTVMLLVSRRPSGKMMLAVFILWLLSLATMTISAIKSPVHFDRQIESAFESVFENDSDILYEEFSEQEIDEFRKQINNMDISTKQEGDVTVTLQGSSENIEKLEATLKIDENGVTISDQDGKLVEITPSGIKIDGKEFIDYTTETIQSVNGSTKAFIFSIGDVKVKIEKDLSGANDLGEAIEKQKEANKQQEEINKEAAKAMKNI
ncbi:MAG: PspC domain-containing protein [Alistipes sp.]|nr:PspC domain-containing protein [Alistipes sp.]